MAKHKEVDTELYNKVCIILKKSGIKKDVFRLANKMHLNLPRLFISKLIDASDEKSKEDLLKNMLGLYGNYIATNELVNAGFKVENEELVPVYDGNKSKNVDLVFSNPTGNKVYCEVKVSKQILDYQKTYYDDEEESLKDSNFYNDIKVYQSIGRKLINQINALCSTGIPVLVIVLNDCYIDPEIIKELKDKNVYLIRLKKEFSKLNMELRQIINNVEEYLHEDKSLKIHRL